ncbi:hypothetical protein [Stigmatella hybrida]|uniref:hypothetical protein n=1 Tax=Stigmatella hybrida TaxID=394097 RepID=UPI001CDA694F|nr:hypothetical protein [Stigmatella hybrida]
MASPFLVDESRLGQLLREDEAVEVIHREAVPQALGAGIAGTPGQIDATAQVQTVGLTGASLGIVASRNGRFSLFSFSANPLALSSEDLSSFVHLSRLFDVSVVLPAPIETPPPGFFGLRANLDFIGAAVARSEFETLSATVLHAQREELKRALDGLTPEQRTQCLELLLRPGTTLDGLAACSPELPARFRAAVSASPLLRKALNGFQDAADASHGGLNVQMDIPTTRSSAVPFRAALLGSGTYGLVRDMSSPWRLDAMASLGPDYLLQSGNGALGVTLAAALAVRVRLLRGMPRLHSSLGLRGHIGQDSQVRVLSLASRPGNYLQAQWGASLPIGRSGVAVSGGMNWALTGEETGQVGVSMNLLYSLPGQGR